MKERLFLAGTITFLLYLIQASRWGFSDSVSYLLQADFPDIIPELFAPLKP